MKKVTAYLVVLIFIVLLVSSVVGYLIGIKGVNPQLWKVYTNKKVDWNTLLDEIVTDCYEYKEGEVLYPDDDDHVKAVNLALGRDDNEGIIQERVYYLVYPVPNTNTCWIYWTGDLGASGVVAYKNKYEQVVTEYVFNVPGKPPPDL